MLITSNSGWNIYNFRLNVINLLLENSYKVFVLCPEDEYVKKFSEIEGLTFLPLKELNRKNQNPLKEFALFWEFLKQYRSIKPDLVLHYTIKPNIYGAFACAILSIPSVAVVTGLGYSFIHKGLIRRLTNFLYRLSFKYHKQIIFENEDDLKIFIQKGIINPTKGIAIKGCGIDTEYFHPTTKKIKTPFVFTYMGRMIQDKGIREFVAAAREIRKKYNDVVFWLIGKPDHDYPATLKEEEIEGWHDEGVVIYQGQKNDIRKYISGSDCIVLPSYREGIPKILLESISMEKVVITTDSPGCREVIEDGQNGFIVPVKEVLPLIDAMHKILLMDESQRSKMGKIGRQKAISEFEGKIIANQIFEIIRGILAQNQDQS